MNQFKKEISLYLLIILLSVLGLSFLGCSESLEIECNCQLVTTTTKIVNNRKVTSVKKTFYSSFCGDDHKVISENQIVICK